MKKLVLLVIITMAVFKLSINSVDTKECVYDNLLKPSTRAISEDSMDKCIAPDIMESHDNTAQIYSTPETNIEESFKSNKKLYDIALSDELQHYTIDTCEQYGIDPVMVFAIMECESAFRSDIISKTNDYGLMQINVCNHKSLGEILGIEDFLNEKNNILAGIYLLSTISALYDEVEKQLMCYNLGVNGAKKYWDKGINSNTYTSKVVEKMKLIEFK